MVVSETLIQMVVSDKGTPEVSDNKEILEVSETVIQEALEIHSLQVGSVILFLSQDQIINSSHSQDITMAASDLMTRVASDPVEDSTPVVVASEAVLPVEAVASDPVEAVEVASDNYSN